MGAVGGLQSLELAANVSERLIPTDHFPWISDIGADHRRSDAVRMAGVPDGEASLDAGVAVIRMAVLVRHHAHDLFALHFGAEAAADAAIGAGGGDAVFGLAFVDQRLFRQRGGGACLHAGAARNAFGVEETGVLAGSDLGLEATALDRQRKRALDLITRAYAARAGDALGGIESEVGIGFVLWREQRIRHRLGSAAVKRNADVLAGRHFGEDVIRALVAIAHLAQADHAGHVLQFAVAVGRAGEAIEWVIGDVQLHHAAADFGQLRRLRADLHAGGDRRGA